MLGGRHRGLDEFSVTGCDVLLSVSQEIRHLLRCYRGLVFSLVGCEGLVGLNIMKVVVEGSLNERFSFDQSRSQVLVCLCNDKVRVGLNSFEREALTAKKVGRRSSTMEELLQFVLECLEARLELNWDGSKWWHLC